MDIPLSVLIIEDSDRDVALELRALKVAGYQVTYAVAESAAGMEAALNKQAFDIVIADNDMPRFDAQGALAMLKQSGQDIPFIIVSGSLSQEIGVALMKAGAHDFVMKDSPARLIPAIQRELKDAESRRERKKAEDELREGRQRLEFALEAGGFGVWDWNLATGFVVYSDLWARIFEFEPDEVETTVEFFKEHIHPEDLEAVLDRLTGHVEGRLSTYESEHRMRTKSGRWLWVMDHGKIVERDKDGHPVRVTGLIADITERKLAENELHRQMEELKRWYAVTVDREDRVIELKKEVNDLLKEAGRPAKYGGE